MKKILVSLLALGSAFIFSFEASANNSSSSSLQPWVQECMSDAEIGAILHKLGFSESGSTCNTSNESECFANRISFSTMISDNCESLYALRDGYRIYKNEETQLLRNLNYLDLRKLPNLNRRKDLVLVPVKEISLIRGDGNYGIILDKDLASKYLIDHTEEKKTEYLKNLSLYRSGKVSNALCERESYQESKLTYKDALFFLKNGKRVIADYSGLRAAIESESYLTEFAVYYSDDQKLNEALIEQVVSVGKNSNLQVSASQAQHAIQLLKKLDSIGFKALGDVTKKPFLSAGYMFCAPSANSTNMLSTLVQMASNSNEVNIYPKGDLMPMPGLTRNHYSLLPNSIDDFIGSRTSSLISLVDNLQDFNSKDNFILGREKSGAISGALRNIDNVNDLSLAFSVGQEMITLLSDGRILKINGLEDVQSFLTGNIPEEKKILNTVFPKKKQLILFYVVAPFAVKNSSVKGAPEFGYDASVYTASKFGSDDNTDIVFIRSDLPIKKNVLIEYVSKGETQLVERLDSSVDMSDPEVFIRLTSKIIKMFPDHESIRLHISGHGGAEKGLLPDSATNGAAVEGKHIMSVDDFGKSIGEIVNEISKNRPKKRFIDNIVFTSCLMSNSSLVYALLGEGARFVSASAETMMGNMPEKMISTALNNFSHSAKEYSHSLSSLMVNATAMNIQTEAGEMASPHAFTYNSISLESVNKAVLLNLFKTLLNQLKESGVDRVQLAKSLNTVERYARIPFLDMIYGVEWTQRDMQNWLNTLSAAVRNDKNSSVTSQMIIQVTIEDLTETLNKIVDGHWFSRLAPFLTMGVDTRNGYERDKSFSLYFPGNRDEYDVTRKAHTTNFLKESGYYDFLDWLYN